MPARSAYIVLLLLMLAAGAAAPRAAIAQDAPQFVPLQNVSESKQLSTLYSTTQGDLGQFVQSLFNFAIVIGAIGAVLRLAYAGYLYMGSDMWSKKQEAKDVIGDVTLGILLLLGIWLILRQINPQILTLDALKVINENKAGGQTAPASSGGSTDAFGNPAN